MERRSYLATAGTATAIGLAGCLGSVGGGSGPVKIGALYPLSGDIAVLAERSKAILEYSVDNIVNTSNSDFSETPIAEGEGLSNHDGREVEIIFQDQHSDPQQGRTEAINLIEEENVDILYGGFQSGVTKTISQAAERRGVPFIAGESSSPRLTERGFEWFWRTAPHDGLYTRTMFDMIDSLSETRDANIETLGLLYVDNELGQASAEAQKEFASEYGWEIVEDITYNLEQLTSLSAEVQRMKSSDPDVMLPNSHLKDAIMLSREMKNQNYMPKAVMGQGTGHSDPEFINMDISDYQTSRTSWSADLADKNPTLGRWSDIFEAEAGHGFDTISIRSFNGFVSMVTALNNAASIEPEAINEALANLQLDRIESGATYPVEFNENHQNSKAEGLVFQILDNSTTTVFPYELTSEDAFVYPAPGWDER
jgi:branched-chain amino acid transport system substrate-binding protein